MSLLIVWWEEIKNKRQWRLRSLVASQRLKRQFGGNIQSFLIMFTERKKVKKKTQHNPGGVVISGKTNIIWRCKWVAREHKRREADWQTRTRASRAQRLALDAALDSTFCLLDSAASALASACLRVCPTRPPRWFPHSPPLIGLTLIQTNRRPDLNGKHYSLLCDAAEDSLTISASELHYAAA